ALRTGAQSLPDAAPSAAATAAVPAALSNAPLTALKDKVSYATGVMTARQLTKNDVAFDLDLMIQGLKDGIADGQIRMSEKELKVVLQSMSADIQRKLSNERKVQASVNREHGLAFQEDYKKKAGVNVLPGNLMYRVIKEGNGDRPSELGKVVVRYQGKKVDGTEFDATPEGKTATIQLSEVITGWKEALKRMPAGSTWEIVVPPTLAYAARGAGSVGPNETLVFNVELVAVVQ
ncbi:MAG: FKBP-type peptidyl-prolyl cis-trans isomerase, partial [Burkholderiaceae bacterium]